MVIESVKIYLPAGRYTTPPPLEISCFCALARRPAQLPPVIVVMSTTLSHLSLPVQASLRPDAGSFFGTEARAVLGRRMMPISAAAAAVRVCFIKSRRRYEVVMPIPS